MKKIYKSLLGITLCLGMASVTNAQVSAYAFSQSSSAYSAITGGSLIATATANTTGGSLDDAIYNLPGGSFPFTFTFNGVGYTGCNISTNGFITFGATAPTGTNYTPISGTGAFTGAISAWGADINSMFSVGTGSVTGDIRFEVVGSAPNREVVIQYSNWRPSYSTSTVTAYALNFQIRLQETTNNIYVVYGPNAYVVGTAAITSSRQIGLRGATNADYNNRLNAAAVSFTASTAGIANTSAQTFSTTGVTPGMPTNGLTYLWTAPAPPSCAVPVSLVNTVVTSTSAEFTWGQGGTETAWDVFIGATPNATTVPTATTSAMSYTATGLTPNTTYSVYVRANCGGTQSNWTGVTVYTGYCIPAPSSVDASGITNVNIASGLINNTTTAEAGNYGDYSAQVANIFQGATVPVNITYATGYTYDTKIWIDFNDDLDFNDVGEEVYTGTSLATNPTTLAATMNISGSATLGTHRLRIGGVDVGPPTPCYTGTYGTFEDYSVNIQPVPTCTLAPVAGTITGPTAINTGTPYSYTLAPSTGDIQWYTSPALTGPWTAVSGATTTPANITVATAGTLYIGAIASSPGCPNDTTDFALAVTATFMGDDVCNAIPLSIGTSAPYMPAGASMQAGEVVPPGTGCTTNNSWCNATLNNSMWFSFVAPASGYVSVNSPGFDTQLAIWKAASCNDLLSSATATLVAANDDDANYSIHGGVQYSSYASAACLTPGATYYIQLDSYSAAAPTESTTIIITDLGVLDASFTGLAANYCLPTVSSSLTPATAGGLFTVNTNTTSVTSFNPGAAGVGTHTVTYSIFGCQSMSTTIVANTPTVGGVASSTIICSGETATLTASGATNYTWSPVGGMSAIAVVSPTANATYTVLGEDNGCTATAMVSVDVNAVPTLSTTSTGSICAGSSATLTAMGATNYTWAPTGDMTATAVVSPTANASYTVTGEALGCSATATISVDVYNVPVVVVSPMSTTICAGTSVTLTASGADSYAWDTGDMTASAVVTPTASVTYTVVGTNACGTATATPMVDVTSLPVVNATTSATLICTGETATLTATGSASYTWAPGGELTASIVVSPTTTATYTVIGSSTCGTATATIQQDVSLCTGLTNLAVNSNVSLFPNPNTGSVNITISAELKGNIALQVYDAIGKLVMTENLTNDNNTINTSKLEAGIYIYKIINNNQEVKVGKMIKH